MVPTFDFPPDPGVPAAVPRAWPGLRLRWAVLAGLVLTLGLGVVTLAQQPVSSLVPCGQEGFTKPPCSAVDPAKFAQLVQWSALVALALVALLGWGIARRSRWASRLTLSVVSLVWAACAFSLAFIGTAHLLHDRATLARDRWLIALTACSTVTMVLATWYGRITSPRLLARRALEEREGTQS